MIRKPLGGCGVGTPSPFVESFPLADCAAGAEGVSNVAGEEVAELFDGLVACVVTGAANTAGTDKVTCFDEAVLAR